MAHLSEYTFENLIEDIANRFDLGAKARLFVEDVLRLIAEEPEGLPGFLAKFGESGALAAAAFEDNGRAAWPLPAAAIEKALGMDAVKGIAETLGVSRDFAGAVLGYALPKIAALLAEDAAATSLELSPNPRAAALAETAFASSAAPALRQAREGGQRGAWLPFALPGAALLFTIGVFGYAIVSGTAGDRGSVPSFREAQNAPQAAAGTPLPLLRPSRLPQGPENAAAAQPPAANANDFAVEAGWIENFAARLAAFGGQDGQVLLAGNAANQGAMAPFADLAWLSAASRAADLPQIAVAGLSGARVSGIALALAMRPSVLAAQAPARVSSQAALETLTIQFPPDSAKIPPRFHPLAKRIAKIVEGLPPGARVALYGYTARTGHPAADADAALSQKRAESVYKALVRAGASPAMLRPKGLGNAPREASLAGAAEGRSSATANEPRPADRRVEFRLLLQQP